MKKFLVLFTALFALTATQAQADLFNNNNSGYGSGNCNENCMYGSFFGGVNWLELSNCRAHANFDAGYLVGGAIGYRYCDCVRVEAELAYRHNELKSGTLKNLGFYEDCSSSYSSSSSCSSSSSSSSSEFKIKLKGHSSTFSVLANVLYDWPFECGCSQTKVYVGGGIGFASQKFTTHVHQGSSSSSSYIPTDVINAFEGRGSNSTCHRHSGKNKNGFAAQFILGMAYNICDNYDATVEYRYFTVNTSGKNENNSLVFGITAGF